MTLFFKFDTQDMGLGYSEYECPCGECDGALGSFKVGPFAVYWKIDR
jgi:hypothetical protein